jgi:hypothetical protein
MAAVNEALTAVAGMGQDLQDARGAVRATGVTDSNGEPIFERDWRTVMESAKTTIELFEKTQPRGGGPAINIGINNNGNGGGGVGQVKTFEQRVREKRGVLAATDVKFITDGQKGEVVDDESDDDDDDVIDDMADGTSDIEIEEADEATTD